MNVMRRLFIVLLWLVAGAQALNGAGDLETARRLAAEADDKAVSFQARRDALNKLESAAQLFVSGGENVEAARTLNRAGRLQSLLNAPNDAINRYRQALSLLKAAAAPEAEVDSLNGMAAAYLLLQDKKQADAALRQSLALSEQSAYTAGEAEALLTFSGLQNYENHVLALQTAQSALAIWQAANDKDGIARASAQIGRCYMAQNILPEATQHYETALQLWRELNDSASQAEAQIMMGFIAYRRGEWGNSITLLTQAESLLDAEAEPERMARVAAGIAGAFRESGLPEIGLLHYQRALDYYRRIGDTDGVGYTTWAIGRAYYLANDYAEAITYLRQALGMAAPDSLRAASCYQSLGMAYIATGNYDGALQHLQQALAIYTRTVNPMEAAQVRGLMGQIAERQGHREQAFRYYQQALATFTKLSDRPNQATIYYAQGQLELKSRQYKAAEEDLRKSIEVTDDIRRGSTSRDLAAAFSATVYDRYETYVDCLMRQYKARPAPDLLVRAFETSEVARGRSLAELLRATEADLTPGLDPQLAEREKSLRLLLRVKQDEKVALLAKPYQPSELARLEAERARLQAEYEEVNTAIRARYPAYQQLTRPAAWTLAQIQEQVIGDDETVLLEYSLGSDQSYVWAITRGGIHSYDLPAGALISKAAQRAYGLLATRPDLNQPGDLDDALRELSALVLSPVAAELNKRRILVVADGALHYIPFQALPAPSGNESLVADCEIINAPSASILGDLRREATGRQPAKLLAAFGDPVFASNYAQASQTNTGSPLAMQSLEMARWQNAMRDVELNRDTFDPAAIQPLFYARRELATLRDAAAGGGASVSSGFAASRDELLRADLSQYAILHFATHGLLDPKRPENSGLLLSTVNREGQAQNGFVGLQDIYGLRAPVDLVVLSACRTALGKDVRGEGLLGLTRGFMYAGASSVMASLWKVDDEATAELMRQTYINMLQKGMTPAAALRAAQNAIRQRPEWQSPYYWAGFTLQGEYRQIIRPAVVKGNAGLYRKGMVIGGLLLLAAVAFWYYRRCRPQAERYSTAKK